MSTGKPRKRPASDFKHITTLIGLKQQDKIDFAWNDMKRFFKISLWDRGHLCAAENCPYPGKVIDELDRATLDHIVPRSRGGRTRLANLQLMHMKCNGRKRNHMPRRFSLKAFTPPDSHRGTVTKYMTKRLAAPDLQQPERDAGSDNS